MGLTGLRAKGLKGRSKRSMPEWMLQPSDKKAVERQQPWEREGLKRFEKVVAFLEDLMVTSGKEAGRKLRLRPFQVEFVKAVYRQGPGRIGTRLVRTAVLSMGRKNGKTQLAAALALCHLCGPEVESRGEIYSCANDRFQAAKIFDEMVAMIQRHPFLADRTNICRHRKEIEDFPSGSRYAALTSEPSTKFGLSPSFVVYDELGQADNRALFDAMDSALGARKEPLMMVISTQAADDHAPLSQLIDYGLQVQRGEIDDSSFYLSLHTVPLDADAFDPAMWELANPALGDFRSLPDVERLARQAKRMPVQENSFRNLILNQRVAAEVRFFDRTAWMNCAGEPKIVPGAKVYAALDLGGTRDLSALIIIQKDIDDVFHVVPYCWLPGDVEERAAQDHVPYTQWQREGYISAIGRTTDPEVIARKIAEINGVNPIQCLSFDRWRIADLQRELDAIGCRVPLIPHGQGFRDMSPAINCLDRLVLQKRIRHGGHPVLTWCALNAIVTRDPAGAIKLDKSKSTGRIDAVVALAMSFTPALLMAERPVDIEALIA